MKVKELLVNQKVLAPAGEDSSEKSDSGLIQSKASQSIKLQVQKKAFNPFEQPRANAKHKGLNNNSRKSLNRSSFSN